MFWTDLNINFPFVKSDYELKDNGYEYVNRLTLSDFVTADFLNFLYKHGVGIKTRALFYAPPNVETPIHIDGLPGDYVKINFLIRPCRSKMNWYYVKDPNNVPEFRQTTLNSNYINYDDPDDVKFVDSHIFHKPTILQVGVPHNVSVEDQHRYAISLGIHYKGQAISMSQAKDIFHKFLL
jgi:hypothetical protein